MPTPPTAPARGPAALTAAAPRAPTAAAPQHIGAHIVQREAPLAQRAARCGVGTAGGTAGGRPGRWARAQDRASVRAGWVRCTSWRGGCVSCLSGKGGETSRVGHSGSRLRVPARGKTVIEEPSACKGGGSASRRPVLANDRRALASAWVAVAHRMMQGLRHARDRASRPHARWTRAFPSSSLPAPMPQSTHTHLPLFTSWPARCLARHAMRRGGGWTPYQASARVGMTKPAHTPFSGTPQPQMAQAT
eukprot:165415-Chlamydomonas_euryale.AAC.1